MSFTNLTIAGYLVPVLLAVNLFLLIYLAVDFFINIKKVNYYLIGSFAFLLMNFLFALGGLNKAFLIVFDIFNLLYNGFLFYLYLKELTTKSMLDQALTHTINNSASDYYLLLDKKQGIVNYSNSMLEKVDFDKKAFLNKTGLQFVVEQFNITELFNKPATPDIVRSFENDIEIKLNAKQIFSFETFINNPDRTHYHIFVKGIYNGLNLIGSTITIYQDRTEVLSKLNAQIDKLARDNNEAKNLTHALLSLTDDIALYFDYQSKKYYTTECFRLFTDSDELTYTFDEFMNMMDPDDVDSFFEQSELINDFNVTRLKYHLIINGNKLCAIDDSIYLDNTTNKVASVIHIVDNYDEVFSTEEADSIIRETSEAELTDKLDEVNKLINQVLQVSDND